MDSQKIEKLRIRATNRLQKLKEFNSVDVSKLTRNEIEEAFHQLQVYQVELEIQNEELINTQSQLVELTEKYHYLYDNAPVGYLSVNMEGLINEGNSTFAELVGVDQKILKDKSVRNWIPREDSLTYYDHRKKLIDTRLPQTFSISLQKSNKTLVPVQITIKLDNDNHPKQILMIVINQTQVKSLQESYRSLVEHSAQGMWLFQEEQLVFANSRACEILECDIGAYVGYFVNDMLKNIDESSWDSFLAYFDEDLEHENFSNPSLIMFKVEAGAMWLELYGTRSNFKGNPAIQFTFVDVTERITSAEKIKKSEHKFKVAAALASDSIYMINVPEGKGMVLSNEGKNYSYDIDYEFYELETFYRQIDRKVQKRVVSALQSLLNEGKNFDETYTVNHPDGSQSILHDRATVLEWDNGKPINILGVTSDITDHKKTELELKELNATKDLFFSIIAHDLKNPFNSIIGFADLLQEEYDKLTDVERKSMITKLFGSAENAFKLVENLLEWSRIQTNHIKPEPEEVDLGSCIGSTLEMNKDTANQKQIMLVNNVPENTIVVADRQILNTIVRNLTLNAVKFTHSGGMVEVSANKDENKNMVIVKVRDNGIGIKKEAINRLFRIENKMSSSGTSGEVGTGLGLILCKEFVKMSGGEIWVESEEGKGSEFYFSLPSRKIQK